MALISKTTVYNDGPSSSWVSETRFLGILVKRAQAETIQLDVAVKAPEEKVVRKRGPRKVKVETSVQPEETTSVTKPTKKVKPPVEPPASYDGEV